MDNLAIQDQLTDILTRLQVLVQMAYETGDGGLAVWAYDVEEEETDVALLCA